MRVGRCCPTAWSPFLRTTVWANPPRSVVVACARTRTIAAPGCRSTVASRRDRSARDRHTTGTGQWSFRSPPGRSGGRFPGCPRQTRGTPRFQRIRQCHRRWQRFGGRLAGIDSCDRPGRLRGCRFPDARFEGRDGIAARGLGTDHVPRNADFRCSDSSPNRSPPCSIRWEGLENAPKTDTRSIQRLAPCFPGIPRPRSHCHRFCCHRCCCHHHS
mmetsp:Transcript_32328/g.76023  ORF Transcript_32328/g.76023 Transcript_32328/m.76023 type:complete len:215 (+) Transcript_32328:736-1380(+)